MRKRTRKVDCGELPRLRKWGQIEFWFDQHHRFNAIVVECDDPNYPVIAGYRYQTQVQRCECEQLAARLIERIKRGRVDYRRLARRVKREFQWDRAYVGTRG